MNKSSCTNSSRIQTNLIQQNCFVRDVARAVDLKSESPDFMYTSLDEVTDDKGIHFEEHDVPYPITPAYVNSFVDSVDYRRDPAGAIANGVSRTNLGDISVMQQVLSMDSSAQRSLYDQLFAKFAAKSDVESVSNTDNEVE